MNDGAGFNTHHGKTFWHAQPFFAKARLGDFFTPKLRFTGKKSRGFASPPFFSMSVKGSARDVPVVGGASPQVTPQKQRCCAPPHFFEPRPTGFIQGGEAENTAGRSRPSERGLAKRE